MDEILGLTVIFNDAVNQSTLHAVQSPPEQREGEPDAVYANRYREWLDMRHAWTVTNIGDPS